MYFEFASLRACGLTTWVKALLIQDEAIRRAIASSTAYLFEFQRWLLCRRMLYRVEMMDYESTIAFLAGEEKEGAQIPVFSYYSTTSFRVFCMNCYEPLARLIFH